MISFVPKVDSVDPSCSARQNGPSGRVCVKVVQAEPNTLVGEGPRLQNQSKGSGQDSSRSWHGKQSKLLVDAYEPSLLGKEKA